MADMTTRPPMGGESTPIIEPGHTYGSVTNKITSIVLSGRTPRLWYVGLGVGFSLVMVLLIALTNLLFTGTGIWGLNSPVGWGFAIINFVWWVGIGHAGTLISAILLLLKQDWRTSINRFAEAMTLFAVACAGIFPLIHVGRPWLAYWLFPYPNTMGTWPQFRSPLVWDVFAVSTYATVSALFWYVGLIPDFATLRDRSKTRGKQMIYGILAMGWRGSAIHWHRYEIAYLLLAGLAAPLVISVHTVVSFDFAVSLIPGWHATVFPPYFVAGAIYSGFAMVVTLAVPLRALYKLEDFITAQHLDNMAKVILRDRDDRCVRLFHGSVHGLVQRQHVRRLHDLEPHDGAVRAAVLAADFLQRRRAAVSVVDEDPPQYLGAVLDFARRERRYVARTLRDRCDEPSPRLPAFLVGHV